MKILIATDGSNASKSVIEAACRLIASPENTAVKIISVVEPFAPMIADPYAISSAYNTDLDAAVNQQTKKNVGQAEADLKEICPKIGDVSHEVLRGGAAPAIVEAACEWGADLIIVGSHGYGFWSRALLGSVSNSVVHHAPCSVLVVREKQSA